MDKTALVEALEITLAEIDAQMDVIMRDAERIGASPYQMLSRDGTFQLTPLLAARATTLAALASLRTV